MYKDFRYINAGENEIYRYGKKAVEKASAFLEERNGYYSFPVDGGKYWTIGTSNGKYGEFMKFGDVIFSVNKGGFAYAKAGTEKGEKFTEFINSVVNEMNRLNIDRTKMLEEKEGEK